MGHRLSLSCLSRLCRYVFRSSTTRRHSGLTVNPGMGITFTYQIAQPNSSFWNSTAIDFGLPYFSISLSLNVLLTFLIVARLVMHSRNVRAAMGAPSGAAGLYRAIVTMLIESCALYAVNSLLFVGPWGAGSHVADIFLPILAEIQVRVSCLKSLSMIV